MLIQTSKQTVEFSLFSQFPKLVCAISTRHLGNLNVGNLPIENALPLLDTYNIPLGRFISMRQVHGNTIRVVDATLGKQCIPDCDGLVTAEQDIYLGVKAADCVPLFFYDPSSHIVATAHAGWKGTLANIGTMVIHHMESLGVNVRHIYVAIGPHIGGCCYSVSEDRAKRFLDKFGPQVSFKNGSLWFVDLGEANVHVLLEKGIKKEHIDAPITCTSCQNDRFFSYRKDAPSQYGEMLGIIGMRGH